MYPFWSPAICNCSYSTYNCLTMLYERKGLLKASKSTVDWPGILAIVYDSWTDVLAMRIFGRSQPVFNFCSLSFHVFENVFENKGQCWSLEMGLDAWLIDLWPLYLRLFRKFPENLKMAYRGPRRPQKFIQGTSRAWVDQRMWFGCFCSV